MGSTTERDDSGGADGADGAARLERQRTEVRESAAALVAAAEQALPGRVSTSGGQFYGCEGAFPDSYRSFAYRAHARVDLAGADTEADPTAPQLLDPMRTVLQQAGYDVAAEPRRLGAGRAVLHATHGELTASVTHAGGRFVGLQVSGPCVEVPKDSRDQWLGRTEPPLR